MIVSTQITNTENFPFIAVQVFKFCLLAQNTIETVKK